MAQLCMSVLDRAFVGQEKEAAVSFKFHQLQGILNLHLKGALYSNARARHWHALNSD